MYSEVFLKHYALSKMEELRKEAEMERHYAQIEAGKVEQVEPQFGNRAENIIHSVLQMFQFGGKLAEADRNV